MDDDLYAWMDTFVPGLADHTWVTSYAPGTGEPDTTKGDYWYCHGEAHTNCELIGQGAGGSEFANSIADDPKSDVGLLYLYDGFCHQMANRLLRFSMDENDEPVTVEGSKGYQASVAARGRYGAKGIGRRRREVREKWEQTVKDYQR